MRRYDFGHHAVSKALGNPLVSIEGARKHFGWIDPRMIEHYYHANLATLHVVAAAIEKKAPASEGIADLLKKGGA